MWAIAGTGQPSNFVRLMAFDSARTLRFSIATVAVHYSLIYFPLIIIFCCARILLPGMEAESDRIMPAMVVFLTDNAGVAWLGGLLVAAPFAAVMSTVDSFLLLVSSSVVRDIYQQNINPKADERTMTASEPNRSAIRPNQTSGWLRHSATVKYSRSGILNLASRPVSRSRVRALVSKVKFGMALHPG